MSNISEYIRNCKSTCVVPDKYLEKYLIYGLYNEVGEVVGKWKKYLRGDYGNIDGAAVLLSTQVPQELKDKLVSEIGDVFWYSAMLIDYFKLDVRNFSVYGTCQPGKADLYFTKFALYGSGLLFWLCKKEDKHLDEHFNFMGLTTVSEILTDFWGYLRKVCFCLGYQPEDIMRMNTKKLFYRMDEGKIKGDGDSR